MNEVRITEGIPGDVTGEKGEVERLDKQEFLSKEDYE